MENDVHLLFRVERALWKRRYNQDTLYIAIRSGIGMAIFQKGHIIKGEFGNAGHIGHMIVQSDGLKCKCGKYGCLERYASEEAIVCNYKITTGEKVDNVSEIIERANNGVQEAVDVLVTAGKYLGVGIANVVNLFDSHNIIVFSCFDNRLILKSAQRELNERINIPQGRNIKIFASKLNEKKIALGAVELVFRKNEKEMLGNV